MELTVYILYIIFAFLIGKWNYSRGNSFWLGLLLSLFLTPLIGFTIVAITRVEKKKLEERELKSGKSKKCPTCAEVIRADARKCRYCNSEVPYSVYINPLLKK